MGNVALAALLLLLVRAAAGAEDARPALGAEDDGPDAERDGDDDGDSAPFTVAVEREDGRRCGGSLLSLRAVLTTADCAEGRGLRAGGAPVARVALAAQAPLAVLQLREAPSAGARPIVVAAAGECDAPSASCYAVSVRDAPRLRVLDVTRVPCAPGGPDRALCFAGPSLCASDRGAGVVCEGKLCGVLSGSASASGGDGCGDPHATHDVTRARRFLHCAHTLRACGRGGDECAKQCTERGADESDARKVAAEHSVPAPAPPSSPLSSAAPELRTDAFAPHRTSRFDELPSRARSPFAGPTPRASFPASAPPSAATTAAAKPPAAEAPATARARASPDVGASLSFWEPNRPDFKVNVEIVYYAGDKGNLTGAFKDNFTHVHGSGSPDDWRFRDKSVALPHQKAGEYGDNAADYGGDESANAAAPAGAAPASASASASTSAASPASPAASTPMLLVPPPEDSDDESDAEMMTSRARRAWLSSLSAASLVIFAITRIAC